VGYGALRESGTARLAAERIGLTDAVAAVMEAYAGDLTES
jgi:hypothetical protein